MPGLFRSTNHFTDQMSGIRRGLTLMFWFGHQFCYHRLDDSDIAIQESSDCSSGEGDPDIGGKPYQYQTENGTSAPDQ